MKQISLGKIAIGCIFMIACSLFSCKNNTKDLAQGPESVTVVGAMKEVMWQGKLGSSIDLDTLSNKAGLFGLGPETYLTGELLLVDGRSFVSRVAQDSSITMEETTRVSAPFFVYTRVHTWDSLAVPNTVRTIQDLEVFLDEHAKGLEKPFAFQLKGRIARAKIHIQNLPEGTAVSSPKEAHQGQVDYPLEDADCTIVGFYSKEHKGIFTHHDSDVHMHLITADLQKMGHLDQVDMQQMYLFLPKT